MALLSDLFGVTGQPLPQTIESPTDELMRRALELNKNAAQPQGITISRPDMPDMVQRALGSGGEQIPTAAPINPGWEARVTPAQPPAPVASPAPQPAAQPIQRPPVQLAPANPATAAAVPQREPTFMDRMAAFASGYQGGGLIGAIANASQGPDKAVQLENQTAKLLAGRLGVTPDEALALAKRPDIMQQLLPVLTGQKDEAIVINNRLVNKKTGQLIADFSDTGLKGPDTGTFEDEDGNKIPWVWDPKAQTRRHALTGQPLGTSAIAGGAPPANVAEGPTQTASIGGMPGIGAAPAPGQPPRPAAQQAAIPAPPPGVNRATWRKSYTEQMAGDTAKANAALPGAIAQTERLIASIEQVEKDPALNKIIGPIDANTPTFLSGSKRVASRLESVESQTFMQAFEALKGAGAITEQEGKAAQKSLSNLGEKGVSEDEYRKRLAEFKADVKTLLDTAKVKAGRLPQDHANVRREAREALRKGAPAEAVRQRLMQNGIDPEGL